MIPDSWFLSILMNMSKGLLFVIIRFRFILGWRAEWPTAPGWCDICLGGKQRGRQGLVWSRLNRGKNVRGVVQRCLWWSKAFPVGWIPGTVGFSWQDRNIWYLLSEIGYIRRTACSSEHLDCVRESVESSWKLNSGLCKWIWLQGKLSNVTVFCHGIYKIVCH